MTIVVNDASILFDLLDIDLVDEFCQLPYEKILTDTILGEFDQETLRGYHAVFDQGLIKIHPLSVDQLNSVIALQRSLSSALSFPDFSCFFLAKELAAMLLTGDKPLRKVARKNRIRAHGILWVFDQLVSNNILDHRKAHQKLSLLMKINKRLPQKECERRL